MSNEGHEFQCTVCGDTGRVPFTPRPKQKLYCADCWEVMRSRADAARSTRVKHGTRVRMPITCSSCGQEAVLDYRPKGVPLDQLVCNECMDQQVPPQTAWRDVQTRRTKKQRRWEIVCDKCGKHDTVPFETTEGRAYLCTSCQAGEEPEPPTNKGPSDEVTPTVRVRRKRPAD